MNDILHLLVGTYTSGNSKGIYIFRFDSQTGDSRYTNMTEVENPSYMVACKERRYIYAVSENQDKPSYVNALTFDKYKERLTLLNRQYSIGDGPCNIEINNYRTHVLTANYGSGNISVLNVNTYGPLYEASQVIGFEGKGPDEERQDAPHIHCVKFSPDNRYIFATDLGTDKIYRFTIDQNERDKYIKKETMKSFQVSAGSGPRHFIFHPCGKFLFLINELAGTVTSFSYNNGNLQEVQTIQAGVPDAKGGGDIAICPNGYFLYASNRLKDDGICIFSIDYLSGRLTKVGYQRTGIHPRNILMSPNGKFLLVACRDSNLIEVYKIDHNTGLLKNIKKDISIDLPVCMELI